MLTINIPSMSAPKFRTAQADTLILTMAPPSQLSIATSSLLRLVKEEASYHKELEQQQSRLQKLEQGGGDENADYTIKQEVRPMNLLSRDR